MMDVKSYFTVDRSDYASNKTYYQKPDFDKSFGQVQAFYQVPKKDFCVVGHFKEWKMQAIYLSVQQLY